MIVNVHSHYRLFGSLLEDIEVLRFAAAWVYVPKSAALQNHGFGRARPVVDFVAVAEAQQF